MNYISFKKYHLLLSILVLFFFTQCKKKDSTSTDAETGTTTTTTETSTESTTTTTSTESSNELASAYPGGLAITMFPQGSTSTTLRLADPEKGKTILEKKQEELAILNGEGDSCLPKVFSKTRTDSTVTCYEFDQEMMYGSMDGNAKGTKDGTDGAGEACLVNFARAQVASVEEIIDQSLGMVQSMMCQAKKAGKGEALPAVDETKDLASELTTATSGKISSITSATMKRIADQSERPVYKSDIVFNFSNKSREVHLVHSPESTTSNATYNGTLTIKVTSSSALRLAGGNAGPSDHYLSVRYARVLNADGTYSLQAELVRGQMASDLSSKAFVNGVLDLNAGADFSVGSNDQNYGNFKKADGSYFSNYNEAISGIMYISFNLNPDDNTGVTSYWQNPGGSYNENARGMIFSLGKNSDGKLYGCGTSGATGSSPNNAVSIRKFLKAGDALKAYGFYHPFFNTQAQNGCTFPTATAAEGDYKKVCNPSTAIWTKPVGTDSSLTETWVTSQMGSIISKQCVIQNSDGKYIIDTSVTTPTAGFELIDTTVTTDASIAGPVLTGLKTLTVP